MKKLFLLCLTPLLLLAQPSMVSELPLPKSHIFNLDPYPCDESCLKEYLDNEMIFSFLANMQEQQIQEESLQEARNVYISLLNIGSNIISSQVKIALLLPYKKIGKYATTTTNAVFAYLLTRNIPFSIKSFNIESESSQDIQDALEAIHKEGFSYIIAPMTLQGVNTILSLNTNQFTIFFPTINKKDVQTDAPNLYFGAIDYQAQSEMLLHESTSPLIVFYDKSYMGKKLSTMQIETYLDPNFQIKTSRRKKVIKYPVASRTTSLKYQLKDNKRLAGGTAIVDTPLVKSGMIMSQLTLYDTNVAKVLSTQINYNPLLLTITQYIDRKNMLIANSITENKYSFIETNMLLRNDIRYNWINYATTIGADLIVSLSTQTQRKYSMPLQNQQIIYPIELQKPLVSRFKVYKKATQTEF